MTGRTRSAAILGAVVVVIAAVAVGTILLTRRDDKSSLTSQERHGRALFADHCSGCHTLGAANAVGRVGPNLDTWAPWGIPPGVVAGAVSEGRQSVYGNAAMPANLVEGEAVDDVAAFVHRVTEDSARRRGGPPPLDWRPKIARTQPEDRPARPQTPPRSPDENTRTNAPARPGP
jgi:mono/diheme cytochrome c family protein